MIEFPNFLNVWTAGIRIRIVLPGYVENSHSIKSDLRAIGQNRQAKLQQFTIWRHSQKKKEEELVDEFQDGSAHDILVQMVCTLLCRFYEIISM